MKKKFYSSALKMPIIARWRKIHDGKEVQAFSPDPKHLEPAEFNKIRDLIGNKVTELLHQLS